MTLKDRLRNFYLFVTGARYIKAMLEDRPNKYLQNIWSYAQNEFAVKHGGVLSYNYEYYKGIHRYIKVKDLSDGGELVRIGGKADGGYTMARRKDNSLSDGKIAYSLGICQDVSWDKEMAEMGYEIFQYDHTIKKLPEENPHFHWEKIGISDGDETSNLKKLGNLIRKNGHQNVKGMVLKADIEGYEWGMFDSLDEELIDNFDQIVLEIHDLIFADAERRRIISRSLKKLAKSHVAVHIHANNNNPVDFCGDLVTPNLLEVTYIKKSFCETISSVRTFPTEIDMANRPDMADIILGKWNIQE